MICLDHNAGGRLRPEVASAVAEMLGEDLGNPSSAHALGRRAREVVEAARDEVAALVGAAPAEVVFTSGATEANNLAVHGCARPGATIVTTAIEHASVLGACDAAAGCRVLRVAPDDQGRVVPEAVAASVSADTALVSVGWANGEIGTIQPIAAIVERVRASGGARAVVHSDAVQAVAFCAVDFAASGLDLLTLSGHKLGALGGVGALVVRRGMALLPLLQGGPQERERRAGTENVIGIASFGVAARLARGERGALTGRIAPLRDRLFAGLVREAAPLVRFGATTGLPNTLSVAFPGLRGDALAIALDLRGVAVSTGAACAAGGAEASPVLLALGCGDELARGALRFSLGPELGAAEIDRAVAEIAAVVRQARAVQGEAPSAAGPVPAAGRLYRAA